MASSNDIQTEKPLIIETPTPENTKVKRGGRYAYAEGLHSHAEGMAAHAEGLLTHAKGSFSHAEGSNSKATGHSSHSEEVKRQQAELILMQRVNRRLL